MSATTTPSVRTAWSNTAPDIWVGSSEGRFAGLIERHGRYTLLDAKGEWLGDFDALDEAQEALRATDRMLQRRRRENVLMAVSVLVGMVSCGVGAAGVIMLTGGTL